MVIKRNGFKSENGMRTYNYVSIIHALFFLTISTILEIRFSYTVLFFVVSSLSMIFYAEEFHRWKTNKG